jgi:hypothetical protein
MPHLRPFAADFVTGSFWHKVRLTPSAIRTAGLLPL